MAELLYSSPIRSQEKKSNPSDTGEMPESLRGQGGGLRLLGASLRRLVSEKPSPGAGRWLCLEKLLQQFSVEYPQAKILVLNRPTGSRGSRPVGTSRSITQETRTGGV